jgi:hypothetical protein
MTAPQWTKKELEDWCLGFCRTPHTTLKAFIDAGFCSDQEPSREELRLWPKLGDGVDATRPSTPYLSPHALARLNRATWDNRVTPSRGDLLALLMAYRRITNPEPPLGQCVRYRGWECCHVGAGVAYQGQEGFVAHLGGADMDAPQVDALTWEGLLDEIDDHDMTEKAI